MKHKIFNTFEEFFNYFEIENSCSVRLLDDSACFEFQPYKNDNVVIRGWIEKFNHKEVQVLLKYRGFRLGRTIWSFNKAKKNIRKIDYYEK